MTLRKRIALFAASAAVIGAGTLASMTKPAAAAPLVAAPYVVADHDGDRDWHDRGYDAQYVRDDQRFFHRDGDRDRRERERREQERREQERRERERREWERDHHRDHDPSITIHL
ncbi:MAG: hypothetical protein JO250_04270 [Armatimonadetes bacterium]|nr:hypothetical protein [Armatimonadota bacterium]